MEIIASYDPYDNSMDIEDLFLAIDNAKRDKFRYFDILVPASMVSAYLSLQYRFVEKGIVYYIHADYKVDFSENSMYMKQLMEFAKQINAKLITLHLSKRLYGKKSVEDVFPALENLQISGIKIAVENLEKGKLGSSVRDLEIVFNRFPDLLFTFDIAHAIIGGQDYLEYYKRFKDKIALVHVSGISSEKKHYETSLLESEVDMKEAIEFVSKLEVPVKIENKSYSSFKESAGYVRIISSLSKRIKRMDESAIKEFSKKGEISLAQGIPIIDAIGYVEPSLKRVLNEKRCFSYTEQSGLNELRKAIAGMICVGYENILITSGAVSGLMNVFLAILDEGDEVILFNPTYPSYVEQIIMLGGKVIFAELENINSLVTEKTKAIVLCNPSNPTGRVLTAEEIRYIIEACLSNGIFLVSDETYNELVYDGKSSNNELFKALGSLYVKIGSFSKSLALSGLRVGYIFADKLLIKEMSKANDAAYICAPSLSQYIVLDLLKNKKVSEVTEIVRSAMEKRRDMICKRLDDMKEWFMYRKPEGALYVFAKIIDVMDDERFARELVEGSGVSVVPGSAFGKKGYIRFSFGAPEEVINQAFDRIETYMKKRKVFKER